MKSKSKWIYKMSIKVLRNYNGGDNAELVEVIVRTPIKVKNCDKHGRQIGPSFKRVSYKGKLYPVFYLPEVYGYMAGNCINLKQF